MLKASHFMQLDLESGAWLTFFKKVFSEGSINKGWRCRKFRSMQCFTG